MNLSIEISKEKACCTDLTTAINRHLQDGQYDLAEERINDLHKSMAYIKQLEDKLKNLNQFTLIANQLNSQGILVEVVKRYANQN